MRPPADPKAPAWLAVGGALVLAVIGVFYGGYSVLAMLNSHRNRDAHLVGALASLVALYAASALSRRSNTWRGSVRWGLAAVVALAVLFVAIGVVPARRDALAWPSASVAVSRARGAFIRNFALGTTDVILGRDTVELHEAWLEYQLTPRLVFGSAPTSARQLVVRVSVRQPDGELRLGGHDAGAQAVAVRHGWRRPPFIMSAPAEQALPDTLWVADTSARVPREPDAPSRR